MVFKSFFGQSLPEIAAPSAGAPVVWIKKRQTLALVMLVGLFELVGAHLYLQHQIDYHQTKITELNEALKVEKSKWMDVEVAQRKKVALERYQQEMRVEQGRLQQFLVLLGRGGAGAICFSHIARSSHSVTLTGFAVSSQRVLAELKEMAAANLFAVITLKTLREEEAGLGVSFQVQAVERTVLS